MNVTTPPIVDKKGRIRYIKPAFNIHSTSNNPGDLMFAVAQGRVDIVKVLLDAGADPNVGHEADSSTPLTLAITEGHLAIVKLLLDRGTDVNARDKFGRTYLALAAGVGNGEIVRTLLDAGAHVDASDNFGVTPLMWAIGEGHPGAVKVLLEAGANIHVTDKNGRSALDYLPSRNSFRLFGSIWSSNRGSRQRNDVIAQLLWEAGA